MQTLVTLYVPASNQVKSKIPVEIRKALGLKRKTWKVYKHSQQTCDRNEFKKASVAYENAVNSVACSKEMKVVYAKSSAVFYRFIKSKLKDFNAIPPLMDKHGHVLIDNTEKSRTVKSDFPKGIHP